MGVLDNRLWNKVFGLAWKQITEENPDIGGFIVPYGKKTVLIDKNAKRILGFKTDPSYEEFSALINKIREYSDSGMTLSVKIFDKTVENATVGCVRVSGTDLLFDKDDLPFFSSVELYSKMDAEKSDSCLMLLRIEKLPKDENLKYVMYGAVNAIRSCLSKSTLMAQHSDREFWIFVPRLHEPPLEYARKIQEKTEKAVSKSGHPSKVSVGICSEECDPAERMHYASFALFEAATKGGSVVMFSHEHYEEHRSDFALLRKFSSLIERNLFIYHFQPIISAHTGEIVAYEALMRTDKSIGLNPLQILEIADKYDRLYDIEYATFRNVLKILSECQRYLENRKIFINAIPSSILSDADFSEIKNDYGELLEKLVIEFTEQTEISDEKLEVIRGRIKSDKMSLAIDDYGTGYSNTSNLLRYDPEYVKIDRSLISGIETNPKMQNIVLAIIEFLHSNGCTALAEGVETFEELETMINLGADLIQGFYISKPKPMFLNEISESVRDDIIKINLNNTNSRRKIYRARSGEYIELKKLALEKYTELLVSEGKVTIDGENEPVKMSITVKNDADCEIVLKNTDIEAEPDQPSIKIGSKSRVKMVAEGSSNLRKGGILVPYASYFMLNGSGDLKISSETYYAFGIGSDSHTPFGNILIDLNGKLEITTNGETCLGIGGAKSGDIDIEGGDISITCSGAKSIGIGAAGEYANIRVAGCCLDITTFSTKSVGIGSVLGDVNINLHDMSFGQESSGNRLCCIGTIEGQNADVNISGTSIRTKMFGKDIICIGSSGGESNLNISDAGIDLYAEGNMVSGIGDKTGKGKINVSDSSLSIRFLTNNGEAICSPGGSVEIVGGKKDIRINE